MTETIVAAFNPHQKRDSDGEWSDGIPGPASRKLSLRGAAGPVHVDLADDGGLGVRIPFDGSDDPDSGTAGHVDSIRLDRATTAEFAEELDVIAQARQVYLQQAQAAWDATERAKPGTPEAKEAQDAWFQVGGDGQRIAGGELDGDTGALVYEMRMGEELETDFLLAIRPAGADPDSWDLQEAAADAAGQYLSMAVFRRLRKALPVAASVPHTLGGGMAELLGVELARPGTWQIASGKRDFTPAMLRDAADFYAATGSQKIALGFGHLDSRFDGEPAFGWVSNVRYTEDGNGPVLLGDLVDMDDWVAAAAPKRWPHRSIEGVAGIRYQGREYGLVLTRLALLGSTPPGIPALKSLSDLRALVSAAAAESGAEWIAASTEAASTSSPAGAEPPPSTEGAGMSLAKIREALAGLPDGASVDEIKAALTPYGLVASQPEPKPAPEPDPQPEPEPARVSAAVGTPGIVTISASVWAETQDTIKGLTAHVEKTKRAERDTIIASAVGAGKFTPKQKKDFVDMWEIDPDKTRALIENLTPNSALSVVASGYADVDDQDLEREFASLAPPGFFSNTKGV